MVIRLLLSAVIFLGWGAAVHAAPIEVSANCRSQVEKKHYLVRGDFSLDFPGARLWAIDRLKRDAARDSDPDSCASAILKQALGDQKEYWDYIGDKYGCTGKAPKSKAKCELYDLNASYLKLTAQVASLKLPSKSSAPCVTAMAAQDPAPAARKLLRDVEGAVGATVQNKAPDTCGGLSEAERRSSASSSGELFVQSFSQCGQGIASVLWKSIKEMALTLFHPGEMMSSLGVFLSEFARDPKKTTLAVAQNLFRYYVEDFENFSCYPPEVRAGKLCQAATKWVATLSAPILARLVVARSIEGIRIILEDSKKGAEAGKAARAAEAAQKARMDEARRAAEESAKAQSASGAQGASSGAKGSGNSGNSSNSGGGTPRQEPTLGPEKGPETRGPGPSEQNRFRATISKLRQELESGGCVGAKKIYRAARGTFHPDQAGYDSRDYFQQIQGLWEQSGCK